MEGTSPSRTSRAAATGKTLCERSNNAMALPSSRFRREGLDEPVEILMTIEKRLDKHALILAVSTIVVDIACQARLPIRRNACIAQEAAVGRTGRHHGDHR